MHATLMPSGDWARSPAPRVAAVAQLAPRRDRRCTPSAPHAHEPSGADGACSRPDPTTHSRHQQGKNGRGAAKFLEDKNGTRASPRARPAAPIVIRAIALPLCVRRRNRWPVTVGSRNACRLPLYIDLTS